MKIEKSKEERRDIKFLPEFSKKEHEIFLYLDKTYNPVNTDCAQFFYKELEKRIGFCTAASMITDDGWQKRVILWVKKNDVSDKILQEKTEHNISVMDGNPTEFPGMRIVEALEYTGKAHNFSVSNSFRNKGLRKKDSIPAWSIDFISFEKYVNDRILYDAVGAVNNALYQYRSYRFSCRCGKFRDNEANSHIFLFQTDADLQRAKENDVINDIINGAYEAVREIDKGNHISRADYRTMIISKEQLTPMQRFGLSKS